MDARVPASALRPRPSVSASAGSREHHVGNSRSLTPFVANPFLAHRPLSISSVSPSSAPGVSTTGLNQSGASTNDGDDKRVVVPSSQIVPSSLSPVSVTPSSALAALTVGGTVTETAAAAAIKMAGGSQARGPMANACFLCQKAKVACDGKTPCSRCVRLNVGHMCLYSNTLLAHANAPSPRTTYIQAPPASALRSGSDAGPRGAPLTKVPQRGTPRMVVHGQSSPSPAPAAASPPATTTPTPSSETAVSAPSPIVSQAITALQSVMTRARLDPTPRVQPGRTDPVYVLHELASMRREHRKLMDEVQMLKFQNERLERNLESAKQEVEAQRLQAQSADIRERANLVYGGDQGYSLFARDFPVTDVRKPARQVWGRQSHVPRRRTPRMQHQQQQQPQHGTSFMQHPMYTAAMNAILSNKALDYSNDDIVQQYRKQLTETEGTEPQQQAADSGSVRHALSDDSSETSDGALPMPRASTTTAGDYYAQYQQYQPMTEDDSRQFLVTEQQQQEQQQQQQTQLPQQQQEDIRNKAMIVIDLFSNPPLVAEVTPLFAELLAFDPSELLNKPWYTLIHESFFEATMNSLERRLRSGTNATIHQMYLRKDGAYLESDDLHQFIFANGRPMYDLILVNPQRIVSNISDIDDGTTSQALVISQAPKSSTFTPSASGSIPVNASMSMPATRVTVDPSVLAMLSNHMQTTQPPQRPALTAPDHSSGEPFVTRDDDIEFSPSSPVRGQPVRRVRSGTFNFQPLPESDAPPPAQRIRTASLSPTLFPEDPSGLHFGDPPQPILLSSAGQQQQQQPEKSTTAGGDVQITDSLVFPQQMSTDPTLDASGPLYSLPENPQDQQQQQDGMPPDGDSMPFMPPPSPDGFGFSDASVSLFNPLDGSGDNDDLDNPPFQQLFPPPY